MNIICADAFDWLKTKKDKSMDTVVTGIPDLDELENLIIPLKKRGINIIFFEMPINKYLCNLLLPETIRDAFKRRFNPEKYTYLKSADCANFNTSDGFHLNKQESQVYTGFFKKEASHLSNSL